MDDRGGLVWRTSSKSSGGACVQVASGGGGEVTHVRDSKDPTGPTLTFQDDAFRAFIAYIRDADV